MPSLSLTPDQLLTTTRTVRKRLDLTRPVEREVLAQCLAIAQQAPIGSNAESGHFVVVTDLHKRQALAAIYRRSLARYLTSPFAASQVTFSDPRRAAVQPRVTSSIEYLGEHLHEVPVHIIPCITVRTNGLPVDAQAAIWGSILPATWSFMLAARARGLGTAWTTLHLTFEEEAAEVLGIPYREVMQAALIPVAYTKGTDFKPVLRRPLDEMVHWESW